ncbi:unnamed protein product, partial [Symbiodinium sp. CCMP2456]
NAAPILVTGSSGYLGSALIRTLRSRGIKAVGMDLVSAETTDFLGCVSDAAAVAAASEAPNLDFYKDSDFERVNVVGTENVMRRADEAPMVGVVFSSTTSLMNTAEVKRRSAAETMVLKASVDYGTPRNIYGVTKKRAEELGQGSYKTPIAILRCSRFFAEDAYDTSVDKTHRSSAGSNGNIKANELLAGTRASLEDMIMAHLLALAHLANAPITHREILGPLVVSAACPLLQGESCVPEPTDAVRRLYKNLGWTLPERFGKIIDSRETWKRLAWQPRWSIGRLLSDIDKNVNRELIESGGLSASAFGYTYTLRIGLPPIKEVCAETLDDNGITIDGHTDLSFTEERSSQSRRFVVLLEF